LVNIEDREQFVNRQQVLNLLRQIEERKFAAVLIGVGVAGNQFANAAGINVSNAARFRRIFFFPSSSERRMALRTPRCIPR
jgi:hypothetical protein